MEITFPHQVLATRSDFGALIEIKIFTGFFKKCNTLRISLKTEIYLTFRFWLINLSLISFFNRKEDV